MASESSIRWQKIKQHPVRSAIITGVGVLVTALIVVVVLGYVFNWSWVGVNGAYSKITTTNSTHGITTAKELLLTKTLWDWLQLLIVPIILAIGGFWLNQIQKSRDERATEQRDTTEREIAADNQREAALQAYLDKMSELLLEKKLRESAEGDETRKIARVRTLTVLRRLDTTRKASVLQFLHESGLLDKNKLIINLSGADLSRADLGGANLSGANLSRAFLDEANLSIADLSGANLRWDDLSGADLSGADLSGADLGEANLSWANLSGANLSGANLSWADLSGADLSGADLRWANLSRALLGEANLSGANLGEANLSGAFLGEANLSRAFLGDANLSRADLRWAFLSGANLGEANLGEANLGEANLSGAFLKDATGVIPEEPEKQAKSLKGATMPDGSIHP